MLAYAKNESMKHERIEMNPKIMGGKPVIKDTRIPVEMSLRKLGAGMSIAEIGEDHPHISEDDIRAAQAFAADYIASDEIIFG